MKRITTLVLLLALLSVAACRSSCTRAPRASATDGLKPGVFEYAPPGDDRTDSTRGRVMLVLSRDRSFHMIGLGHTFTYLVPFGGKVDVDAAGWSTFTPTYTAWDSMEVQVAYRKALDLSDVPLLPTGRSARQFVASQAGSDTIAWPDSLAGMGYGRVVFRRLSGSPAPWLARLVERGMEDAEIGAPSPRLAGTYRLDKASLRAPDEREEYFDSLTLRAEGTFSARVRVGVGESDLETGAWYRSGDYLLFKLLTNNGEAIQQSPGSIITAQLVQGRIRIPRYDRDLGGPHTLVPVQLAREP